MITVINEIKDYTYNDEEGVIIIKSHWNSSDKVVLQIGSSERVFFAKDLLAAIENSKNVARY
jgi:hypothetical protein